MRSVKLKKNSTDLLSVLRNYSSTLACLHGGKYVRKNFWLVPEVLHCLEPLRTDQRTWPFVLFLNVLRQLFDLAGYQCFEATYGVHSAP
jgi:hypothetical protein